MIHWRVVLAVAPPDQQRFPTAGDWYEGGGIHRIVATRMGDEDAEFLVWLHHLLEWYLCRRRGIPADEVRAWKQAPHGEPPHGREREFAARLTREMAEELGVVPAEAYV